MSRLGPLHSSASDDWATPQHVFDWCNERYGPLGLDVAASASNAKCAAFYIEADNGLTQPWPGRVWMNPPYGRGIGDWIRKAIASVRSGEAEFVVALVPARVDTAWFQLCFQHAAEILFVAGRLKFGGSPQPAPFPSAIVVFRPPMVWSSSAEVTFEIAGTSPELRTVRIAREDGSKDGIAR